MLSTSLAYKNEQLQPLREKSYVYIYLGIINQNAKANAKVLSGLTAYSDEDSAFRNKTKDAHFVSQYATLEDYFTRVDGSNSFLPREPIYYNREQGLVSADVFEEHALVSIIIKFGNYTDVSMKGLTIDFGDEFPLSFTIANDHVEYEYEKDAPGLFQCEDQFDNSSFIRITATEMFYGHQRLRIRSIEFGVGLSFENEQIISTQRKNSISHISDALPLKQFDFTLVNLTRKFSQDNPWSFASYVNQGQEVDFEYGREIIDELGNTTIYRIPGGKTYIKTWSSTDMQAKFSTVGYLDLIDEDYYKGTLDTTNTRTAYDVALEVINDAGIENYRIDSYLKTILMRNPLPIANHKTCLQTIANATRSVLYEDRYGKVVIESSFIPDAEDTTTIFYNAEMWCDEESLLSDVYIIPYATLENAYTRVDNTMYFLPRSYTSTLENAAFVSFNGGGGIEVYFGAQWTFYNVGLVFSETIPDSALIEAYSDDVKIDEFTVTEFSLEMTINREFIDCDRLKITFNCSYNRRVHLETISFNATSGYTLTNVDLMQMPTATSINQVKEVNVNYYSYALGTDIKQITSSEVDYNTNVIKLSNPSSNYTLLWDDGTQEWNGSTSYNVNDYVRYLGYKYRCKTACQDKLPTNTTYWVKENISGATITSSGAYHVTVNVSDIPTYPSGEHAGEPMKLLVYGALMLVNYNTYKERLHDLGDTRKLNNVLLQSERNAEDCADWLSEYFENDTEYNISYRGEPALECDDLIYLENQFVKENLCRITEEELSTSIGMNLNNTMKLRRVSYAKYRDAVVGYAIVDLDRVAPET